MILLVCSHLIDISSISSGAWIKSLENTTLVLFRVYFCVSFQIVIFTGNNETIHVPSLVWHLLWKKLFMERVAGFNSYSVAFNFRQYVCSAKAIIKCKNYFYLWSTVHTLKTRKGLVWDIKIKNLSYFISTMIMSIFSFVLWFI